MAARVRERLKQEAALNDTPQKSRKLLYKSKRTLINCKENKELARLEDSSSKREVV